MNIGDLLIYLIQTSNKLFEEAFQYVKEKRSPASTEPNVKTVTPSCLIISHVYEFYEYFRTLRILRINIIVQKKREDLPRFSGKSKACTVRDLIKENNELSDIPKLLQRKLQRLEIEDILVANVLVYSTLIARLILTHWL